MSCRRRVTCWERLATRGRAVYAASAAHAASASAASAASAAYAAADATYTTAVAA